MAVKVQFQIGHTSKLRSKKTVEGFTHDWELYVKGVNQADISAFVEKIIFNLHESFQKPKRVCNKPPYVIQESGYAGFIVFIDIYFRNRDEPKKVQFNYDLDLQQTGPPQHRHDIKTFIFDNPAEEYRLKLLKGGGVPVSGVVGGSQSTINNNNIVAMQSTSAVNLNHSPGDGHKAILSEGKKHKLRPDDTRSNSFANLFGPPITKTTTVVPTVVTKPSPDNKTVVATGHATHQSSSGTGLPAVKEKSSKDKEKSSEKSKERSEKREKHHKQSLTSPHKEGRSESKKSEKHEKRDKTEEKSKKDKNRDKERERDRDKSSGGNVNNSSSSSKKPPSPKPVREQSPHKPMASSIIPTNTAANNANNLARPSSSSSGKIEEIKTTSKSSKDPSGESKSKESKQKESSSSSGKKSKKEKKDRDKEKERDKEKRHEEREKQKLADNQQKSNPKDDNIKVNNNINTHTNSTNSLDNKSSKTAINPLNTNTTNEVAKKPEKLTKQDVFKTSSDKTILSNTILAPPMPVTASIVSSSTHSSTEKKSSSSSSLNSNSNQPEKDKRSHKHKKKEKNKDKDKDRERDKEREKDKESLVKDKDKDKEKDKEKEKEKEIKKEKEAKEKQLEEKPTEKLSSNQQTPNVTKPLLTSANVNATEDQAICFNTPASSTTMTTAPPTATAIPSVSSLSASTKLYKNKDKKSKDKSSTKEEKLKHKLNNLDASESKAKQAKLSNNNSTSISSALSTSSSSSSVSNSITNAITTNAPNPTQSTAVTTVANSSKETNLNLDLSNVDSLPVAPVQQVTPLPNDSLTKPSLKPSPIITHSDSSNSSFPDLPLTKQHQPQAHQPSKPPTSREHSKSFTAPAALAPIPLSNTAPKEPPKTTKMPTKEKLADKPPKEEEKEKKRRRNSQAVNTFIEPPSKQLKTKEQPKSVREKSKSPSLRNTGSRASISAETSVTFLQPSSSPSSTAAAAPLPPPTSASSAAHSPALSATEAVGNATSATANAATCNNNSAPSSTTNSTGIAAPHHLPLDYLSELQELHHKIMTLQDNEDLQHVVELIAATGCYEITTKTFDFDLCKLDRGTVQRLQDFFATSVS